MKSDSIRQAVLLAAGTGSRLMPLTREVPKCMVPLAGRPLIDHLLDHLESFGIEEVVVVTGYKAEVLEAHLRQRSAFRWRLVHNQRYATTNNILSLHLAKAAIEGSFLLLESDLYLDAEALRGLLVPDRMLVSRYTETMDGTGVCTDAVGNVTEMILAAHKVRSRQLEGLYKTVNCYSFSAEVWNTYAAALSRWIEAQRLDQYYEAVLAELIARGEVSMRAEDVSGSLWAEVDTPEDLRALEARLR